VKAERKGKGGAAEKEAGGGERRTPGRDAEAQTKAARSDPDGGRSQQARGHNNMGGRPKATRKRKRGHAGRHPGKRRTGKGWKAEPKSEDERTAKRKGERAKRQKEGRGERGQRGGREKKKGSGAGRKESRPHENRVRARQARRKGPTEETRGRGRAGDEEKKRHGQRRPKRDAAEAVEQGGTAEGGGQGERGGEAKGSESKSEKRRTRERGGQ